MIESTVDTRWLVCEGRCNPRLDEVDDLTRRVRDAVEEKGLRYPLDRESSARIRSLVHTPHQHYSTGYWECSQCGNLRRY